MGKRKNARFFLRRCPRCNLVTLRPLPAGAVGASRAVNVEVAEPPWPPAGQPEGSDAARPHRAEICEHERIARLRLIRSENVGPITFRRLVARCGSARAALVALPRLAWRGGTRVAPRICTLAEAEAELAALAKVHARLVASRR